MNFYTPVLNTKLNQIIISPLYLVIQAGSNYAWGDEPLIDPDNYGLQNPENIPLAATLISIGSSAYEHKLFITRAHFSEYGTVGIEFNMAPDVNLSIAVALVYRKQ